MMRKYFLLLLLITIQVSKLFSQQIYDSVLNELSTKYPQEKIYLQFDKNYYSAGETVWFKAYLKSDAAVSKLSTSMYAELINEKGAVIERKTMPILLSGAGSNFVLPDSLKSSKLFVRAFTSWMLNFDSSLLYVKPVNILNTTADATAKNPHFTLTFFPEGGDLVTGVESKLAFKTNDETGKPFTIKGKIISATGTAVSDFSSTHNGMGVVAITPANGESYKAVWKDPAGKQQETLIPKALPQAATLSLIHNNSKLNFTIKRAEDATDDMKEFVVIAQMQQQTVYAAKINLKNKLSASAPIPIDSLPDGIMQVTLFNKAELPVAERIIFVKNNNQYFTTDLHIIEKNIKKKGRNVLQVDVGGTLKSNLSVSVTDADLDFMPPARDNIYSELLLSADVKGKIYNAAYYFSSDEDSVARHLDLVMMTNGWRRFNWKNVLANQWPTIKHVPENYLSVAGNVFGLSNTQLNDKMVTGFIETSKQAEKTFFSSPINKDGSFKIDQLYFFDTIKLYYQISGDKNKRLTEMASFSFKNNLLGNSPLAGKELSLLQFAPAPPKAIALKSITQNEMYQSFQERKNVKVLDNIVVTTKTKSLKDKVNEEYASGMFNSGNSRIFTTEDDPFARSAISVLDYLRSKVPGLQITTSGIDGGSVTRRGSNTDLFLNEMNADVSLIQSTPMTDVAMIKVFDPPFFGSFGGGAGGAVAVYTKKGGGSNDKVQGLNVATVRGYSTFKEFYSPDYSTEDNTVPDYRSTLLWKPFLLMDEKNKRVTLPFFNNDNAKRIRVIIEGINELGQISREEKIFE